MQPTGPMHFGFVGRKNHVLIIYSAKKCSDHWIPIKRVGIHESAGGPLLVVHGVITPLIAVITKFYNCWGPTLCDVFLDSWESKGTFPPMPRFPLETRPY